MKQQTVDMNTLQPELITIYCKNTQTNLEVPVGAQLIDIYALVGSPLSYRPLSARVNNRMESLTYRCWGPKEIEFVDYTDPAGARTYLRSLCYILCKAVYDLFPQSRFNLEHPVSRGYYGRFEAHHSVTAEEVEKIQRRMEELIQEDIPFVLKQVRTSEAIALFRKHDMNDKALLIETTGLTYTSYYQTNGYIDYFYGCLTPSSGYLSLFGLIPYAEGLLLQVPHKHNPERLATMIPQNKMFQAYKEHLNLQRMLNINYIGELNKKISIGEAQNVILVSEAMQEKQIAKIAEQIAERYKKGVRIVLISGPSSSGKTTFCQRLQIQLITNLLNPISISLDDYYVDRELTPKDEDGNYDFESLYAIDLPYFEHDLDALIAGKEIETPSFDFQTGKRVFHGESILMKENSLLLIEGIHGLNPALTAHIAPEKIFRVYVSALTTISLDGHNWIPTTDNRLLRRIVRDYRYRGYSAKETIDMWSRVRKGEDQWIFPYQENADAMFNSAMIYEFAALRKFAEPILSEIREVDKENAEAYRLLRFLRYFNHIPLEELPKTSLLREFLGGGHFS